MGLLKKIPLILAVFLFFPAFAEAKLCHPGDQLQVLWHGNWYPATALKGSGGRCFIHYNGYGSNWDEWVGPGRLRVTGAGANPVPVVVGSNFQAGDAVQVLWGGKWWPAQVLKAKGNKLYIHYDGYGSNWDEWVGPARYRRP